MAAACALLLCALPSVAAEVPARTFADMINSLPLIPAGRAPAPSKTVRIELVLGSRTVPAQVASQSDADALMSMLEAARPAAEGWSWMTRNEPVNSGRASRSR